MSEMSIELLKRKGTGLSLKVAVAVIVNMLVFRSSYSVWTG